MNYNYETIITHNGQVHADDMLSLMALLAVVGIDVSVFRRDPTEEELEDPEVLCVDVGGRHEPDKGNYDHHQFDKSNEKCALSLLIADEEHFPELSCLCLAEWVGRVAYMDTQGPYAMAKRLEIEPPALFQLTSRVEGALKSLLAKTTGEMPLSEDLKFMLCEMGQVILEEAEAFQKSYSRLMQCPVKEVGGVLVLVNETTDTMAGNKVRETLAKVSGVELGISVCHDDRGEGWTFFRYADDPRVDFSKLMDHKEIAFSHAGGFIAKTKTRLPLEEALQLISLAL